MLASLVRLVRWRPLTAAGTSFSAAQHELKK